MGLKLLFKKNIIFILLIMIFLLGCKKNEEKVVHKKIKNKKLLEEVVPWRGWQYSVEIYDNDIYFMGKNNKNSKNSIIVYDKNYNKIRRIDFKKGKGPGELMYPFDFEIFKNKIFVYDDVLKRISVFNLNGKYLDDYKINFVAQIGNFIVVNDYFIFSGFLKNKLVKYNYKKNEIVKKIDFKNKLFDKNSKKMDLKNKQIPTSFITLDVKNKKIFLGKNSKPIRVEIYDYDLNKVDEFEYNLSEEYEELHFGERNFPTGDNAIGGIYLHNNNIYITYGGLANREVSKDFYILVFDRNSYKYKYTIKNEKLNNINSFISIGGIINNEFNLIVKEKDNKRSSFLGYKKDNKYITVLLNLEI